MCVINNGANTKNNIRAITISFRSSLKREKTTRFPAQRVLRSDRQVTSSNDSSGVINVATQERIARTSRGFPIMKQWSFDRSENKWHGKAYFRVARTVISRQRSFPWCSDGTLHASPCDNLARIHPRLKVQALAADNLHAACKYWRWQITKFRTC